MLALLSSFALVALAEMGDKTQLVALAFAAKYKARTVLLGVLLATLLVHLFSVLIGTVLAVVLPRDLMHLLAGVSFLGFGVWSLRGDSLDSKPEENRRFGQLFTVASAFFLAELGDKTQLATISLATEYYAPIEVWLGSTLGMVAADGLAIAVGLLAAKNLPERPIRLAAACVFVISGLYVVAETLGLAMTVRP